MPDTTEVADVVVASTGQICLEKHRLLSKIKARFLAEGVGVIGDVDGKKSDELEML